MKAGWLALIVWTAVGCHANAASTAPADAEPTDVISTDAPETTGEVSSATDWNRVVTAPEDWAAAQARGFCTYRAGDLPAETQGKSHPMGKDIPIDHFVIVMHENRSFDHFFWKLREHGHPDAEVAPADYTNPDANGQRHAPFHDKQLCFIDTAHSWNQTHTEWNLGKMDGFVMANDKSETLPAGASPSLNDGTRSLAYYEPEDIPFMYWAADEFAIADHYHCSLLTSTSPNRMFLYAANSFGSIHNEIPAIGTAMTLFDELSARGVAWKVYAAGAPPEAMFLTMYTNFIDHFTTMDQFFADAASGELPAVAFVEGKDDDQVGFDPANNDEHPPGVMQVGQAVLAAVTQAVMAAPTWKSSALFITYDEHGGLWDHVPPPPACPPDATPLRTQPGDVAYGLDRLGVRVPFLAISPFAKKGYVGHHIYDHTSIVRFVQARFTLPALSGRDANAEAPWDLFDFGKPRADLPIVPNVPVNQAVLDACLKLLGP